MYYTEYSGSILIVKITKIKTVIWQGSRWKKLQYIQTMEYESSYKIRTELYVLTWKDHKKENDVFHRMDSQLITANWREMISCSVKIHITYIFVCLEEILDRNT